MSESPDSTPSPQGKPRKTRPRPKPKPNPEQRKVKVRRREGHQGAPPIKQQAVKESARKTIGKEKPPEPPELKPTPDGPEGIGGWLIWPMLGLFGTPLLAVVSYFQEFRPLLKTYIWKTLTTPSSENYIEGFAYLIYAQQAAEFLFALVSVPLLVLLFKKHQLFPSLMIANYVAKVVVSMLLVAAVFTLPITLPQLFVDFIRTLIISCIWILYFQKSKRVMNTFKQPDPPKPVRKPPNPEVEALFS